MKKEPEFKVGQVWESEDKLDAYLLVIHDECSCEVMRPLYLRCHGRLSYKLGLAHDDFDRKYAVENNYRCFKDLASYIRKRALNVVKEEP